MKSHDVTQPGFYWYFAPDEEEKQIVLFREEDWFEQHGTEITRNAAEMPGEFIGPIRYEMERQLTVKELQEVFNNIMLPKTKSWSVMEAWKAGTRAVIAAINTKLKEKAP